MNLGLFAALVMFALIGAASDVSAQGRSGSRGNSGNSGAGRGNSGSSQGGGVDRGLGTASTRSNSRSDAGIERARLMRENSNRAEREINDNPRLQDETKMNANDLRDGYQAALASNPNLKFGQYVAAQMIARNLGARNPNITSSAILGGLANGDSIGTTLKSLGVSSDETKRAEKDAKDRMKKSKN
ncbi:MAG: hypothetical protein ABIP06_00280 [Pyrinomonadaceae bacterium]